MAERLLTEPEAWRAIGEKIERRESISRGLCLAIWELLDDAAIGKQMVSMMRDRCDRHVVLADGFFGNDGYAFEPGTEWEARAMAAYWLALEAEEES